MKTIFYFLIFSVIAISACNNAPQTADDDISKKDTTANKTIIPVSVCYASNGKDTINLKVELIEKTATGSITYKLFEKDSNTGNFTGSVKSDTLLADYTFMSEGTQSVRQVIFLLQDSVALEGYGDMEDKNGKMVFKNTSTVIFGKGTRLQKTNCDK